MTYINFR